MSQITPKPPILGLPTELHLYIFSYLDPVFSTCLGLTCKPLYLVYQSLRHKVCLFTESRIQFATLHFTHRPPITLHHLLLKWAKPLVFCHLDHGRFVTPRRRVEKVIRGLELMEFPRDREEERWLRVWERELREDVDWNAGREVKMGSELWDLSASLSHHLRGIGL